MRSWIFIYFILCCASTWVVGGLIVDYGDKLLVGGQKIDLETQSALVANEPSIICDDCRTSYYALIMYDPDAPNCKNYVHWFKINLRSNGLVGGSTLMNYVAPSPSTDSGVHHYVFALLKSENGNFNNVAPPSSRCGFNVASFVSTYALNVTGSALFSVDTALF